MKILTITAQKPHSTGSGFYLTEMVKGFAALGHEQAVLAGVYREDTVDFPTGTVFYPVHFKKLCVQVAFIVENVRFSARNTHFTGKKRQVLFS